MSSKKTTKNAKKLTTSESDIPPVKIRSRKLSEKKVDTSESDTSPVRIRGKTPKKLSTGSIVESLKKSTKKISNSSEKENSSREEKKEKIISKKKVQNSSSEDKKKKKSSSSIKKRVPSKKRISNSSEKEKSSISSDEGRGEFGISIISLKEFLSETPHKTQPTKKKYTLSESPTEKEIYELAVEAYKTGNMAILSNLNIKKKLSDKFFWIFLAEINFFFYETMEIEMFRRRDMEDITLVDIGTNIIELVYRYENGLPLENIIKYNTRDSGRDARLVNNYRFYKETIGKQSNYVDMIKFVDGNEVSMMSQPSNYQDILKEYPSDFIQIIEKVSSLGGTIAGGFVTGLINPVYYLVKFEANLCDFSMERDSPYSEGDDDFFRYYLYQKIDSPSSTEWFPVPNLDLISTVFYSRYLPEDTGKFSGDWEEVVKCRKKFKDYDLEEALEGIKKHIHVRNNSLYRKYLKKSPDVDIFIEDDNYEEKVKKIIEFLYDTGAKFLDRNYICSEFATTFTFGRHWPKIQIIKRAYKNIGEILAGFDLDPSRAALILKGGKLTPVVTKSFITSVKYGVNLIVPSRQSETFNSRIVKYWAKGFEPLLVAEVPEVDRSEDGEYVNHTLDNLLANFHNEDWNTKGVSDYEDPVIDLYPEYFENEIKEGKMSATKRLELIKEKELTPTFKDVAIYGTRLIRMCIVKHYNVLTKPKYIKFYGTMMKFIVTTLSSLNWRTIDPGSQITGSFNPTKLDYLASKENKEIIIPKKNTVDLGTGLPTALDNIIFEYSKEEFSVISYLIKIEEFLAVKNVDKEKLKVLSDKLERLIKYYNSGKMLD